LAATLLKTSLLGQCREAILIAPFGGTPNSVASLMHLSF
jgi:hypothetical protein